MRLREIFLLLLLFKLSSAMLFAQNSIIFGGGVSGTTRFLNLHNESLSSEEFSQLKALETIKPSYSLFLGYLFEYDSKIDMQLNLGYGLTRYGTRIYLIPDYAYNNTPQYRRRKEVVSQKQFNLDYLVYFKNVSVLRSKSLFTKLSLVYNHLPYKIFSTSYDDNNVPKISGYTTSDAFQTSRFNVNLNVGLNYNLYKKLLIQPYIGTSLIPYRTTGQDYSYLYFNSDITGFLCEIGLNLSYMFR